MNVSRVLKFFLNSLRDDLKPIEILRFYCYNINSNLSEVRKVGAAPHTPLGAPLWCMLSAGKCTELSHTGKCDLEAKRSINRASTQLFHVRNLIPTMKPLDSDKKAAKEAEAPAKAAEAAPAVEANIDFSNGKIEPIFKDMVDFETFAKSDYRAVKILACEAVPKSKKQLKFTLDDGERKDRVILSGIHEYYEPEELVGKTAIAIVNLPPAQDDGHRLRGHADLCRA